MSDTTTPAARHALYAALEGAIGKPHADTLMTYLPAHRSNEAATKADVEILEDRFDHWQRTTLVVVVSAMTGLTAIFSAIVLLAT